MNVRLLRNELMVLPAVAEDITKGGIIVPTEAREKPSEGTVIECGPDCQTVQKGNYIFYDKNQGTQWQHPETEQIFLLIREHDVKLIDDDRKAS